jgi:mRNA-degrading endonuclease toxin of MazEF toxin-antitoxin module
MDSMPRGDVVDVYFGDPEGHEDGWTHPALIVSDDNLEMVGRAVVCPITSARRSDPSQVEIEPGASGLSHASYIETELVLSLIPIAYMEYAAGLTSSSCTESRSACASS